MADLLELSARFIDEGVFEGPGSVNRPTTQLSEVADGIGFVEAFSHVIALRTDDGLVLFDTSLEPFAPRILESLRRWSNDRVHTLVYTHGHIDHVGGAGAFVDEARSRNEPRPNVVAHEGVSARFDRYAATNGYNFIINARQFGALFGDRGMSNEDRSFGPKTWIRPSTTFADRLSIAAGGLEIDLRHARGETDDHLWAWIPERRAVCAGDFVTWVFPNAGNPQKVQRYPLEWARALRAMQALEPELLLPAHGLPVGGADRVRRVLGDIAAALEVLVEQTLRLMNQGARLDTIVHSVKLPKELLERPYLQPVYDEPEFVVNNVWRLYGGWYDGNPANLKPAPEAALAAEIAALAGGAKNLAERGRALAEQGELRLACHLVELASLASPDDAETHTARAEVYAARRKTELSLMAKGIYRAATTESEEAAARAAKAPGDG